MRTIPSVATLAVAAVAATAVAAPAAGAQDARILTRPDVRSVFVYDSDRPMIGVTTAGESERADTLGLRIDEVRKDSPADKAGLKAGDRLQSINGVSLRADRADAGEDDYTGVLNRRLQREVQKTKEGEAVELRVLSGGQVRTVRVTPAKARDVMDLEVPREGTLFRSMRADRPVLGLSVTSTGSVRDTLGIFVSSVVEDGPAEKAGIVEGDRIAAINGVSLKVAREDAEDRSMGQSRVERLNRELAKLEAGQAVELTVVSAGRSRSVRVTPVKASDLPQSEVRMFTMPGGTVRVMPNRSGNTFYFRSPEGQGGTFELRMPEMERMRELAPRLREQIRAVPRGSSRIISSS
jgi:serine protease Do